MLNCIELTSKDCIELTPKYYNRSKSKEKNNNLTIKEKINIFFCGVKRRFNILNSNKVRLKPEEVKQVSIAQKVSSIFAKFVEIDNKADTLVTNGTSAANLIQQTFGGDAALIKQVKEKFFFVGPISFLSNVKNTLTGRAFVKKSANGSVQFKSFFNITAFLTGTASKAIYYGSSIASFILATANLLKVHPTVGLVLSIANIASKALLSLSMSFRAIDRAAEMYQDKRARTIHNCVKIINVACLAYVLAAPLIVANPPLFAVISIITNVTTAISFAIAIHEWIEEQKRKKQMVVPFKSEATFTVPCPEIQYVSVANVV